MLKIWGRRNAINVMKVLWCADELGLEYEHIDAGMEFGQIQESWYVAMNPNSKVPTIDDDGLVLWESNSIIRYLAAKHDLGGLIPADPGERALSEKWMDWQLTVPHADMRYLFWGLVRKSEKFSDKNLQTQAIENLNKAWSRLDAVLSTQDYVGGPRFTAGDIPVGCFAWRWTNLPINRVSLPNLEAWQDRLKKRPAFQKNVMTQTT